MTTAGTVIKCQAAVIWNPGQPATIETVEVAVPKAGEIRIKMAAAGICYSDVSLGSGRYPHMAFPTVLGHEGVGIVESLGEGVTSFQPGDTVVPLWSANCGKCRLCRRARRNTCESVNLMMAGLLLDGTTRLKCKGTDVRQTAGLGLFSEYVVLPEIAAVKVSPSSSLEKLTPFGCCMPTGYGAAVNTARVDRGATVAVWGLGAIGLCAALGCRDAGATRIIGIDVNTAKFEIGSKFGCTDTLNPGDHDKSVPEVLMEMTNGDGLDYAFVCVGNLDAMADAFEACSAGSGECVIVGIGPDGATFPVNHYDLVKGKTLKGSNCGDCYPNDIKEMVDKYLQGKFPTDLLISNVIPLEQIKTGFDLLKAGKAIRTVVKF